jgi:hypothetical protein
MPAVGTDGANYDAGWLAGMKRRRRLSVLAAHGTARGWGAGRAALAASPDGAGRAPPEVRLHSAVMRTGPNCPIRERRDGGTDGTFPSYRQGNLRVSARRWHASLTWWAEQGDRVENVPARGRPTWHQRFTSSQTVDRFRRPAAASGGCRRQRGLCGRPRPLAVSGYCVERSQHRRRADESDQSMTTNSPARR